MNLPPCVIVHGLPMAEQALAAARAAERRLTLLSGQGAGAYAGVGWWQALIGLACPQGDMPDILDCGSAPGRALEALRAGQRILVLRAEPAIWADVAARAEALGARLLDAAPPALDMARPGAMRSLPAWLEDAARQSPG